VKKKKKEKEKVVDLRILYNVLLVLWIK